MYDGDGQRVKATLSGVTTAYMGNYYEQSGSITTTYYYASGTRVATPALHRRRLRAVQVCGRVAACISCWAIIPPSAPPLRGHGVGSTSLAANGTTGALVSEQRYKPVKYIDSGGHFPFIPLLIAGGILLFKAIDYGWTAHDAYQSGQTLADPNLSLEARLEA